MSDFAYHRMPLGYGPFPGPRQGADGKPMEGWELAQSCTYTVVFLAPKRQLESFLPASCFEIQAQIAPEGQAYASISFTRLENLPWLAGRGYNHSGLYIHDVICHGKDEDVSGKYLSVLFENRGDPITSGREELGYAKVFASLDEEQNAGDWTLRMGWENTIFGEMHVGDVSASTEDSGLLHQLQPQNVLHYKYIPRTGRPGEADVQYPTISPIPPASLSTVKSKGFTLNASIKFQAHGFQELPTLHHITKKLAGIEITRIVGASMVATDGASDFRSQRSIQIS
ncbi:FAD binding domain-containing protein [Penicillium herquei]|nr:FAD binding domain-containing protein [Penicillium herquei]